MYAIGLCIDRHYLTPGLAVITGLADSLSRSARRDAALRVLTLDLSPAHALLLSDLGKRAGFGSLDLAHRSPLRLRRMADASYITVTTYLRFEFTAAFVRRPYLIYVDADTLVRGDLTVPLNALATGELGAVPDEFNPAVGECPALPGAAERWPHLKGRPYYNAGLLWAHTADLPDIRRGVERALLRQRQHILHNNQDALNLWLLHAGRVRPVDAGYNHFEVGRYLERGNWIRRVVSRPLRADPAASRMPRLSRTSAPSLAGCIGHRSRGRLRAACSPTPSPPWPAAARPTCSTRSPPRSPSSPTPPTQHQRCGATETSTSTTSSSLVPTTHASWSTSPTPPLAGGSRTSLTPSS